MGLLPERLAAAQGRVEAELGKADWQFTPVHAFGVDVCGVLEGCHNGFGLAVHVEQW